MLGKDLQATGTGVSRESMGREASVVVGRVVPLYDRVGFERVGRPEVETGNVSVEADYSLCFRPLDCFLCFRLWDSGCPCTYCDRRLSIGWTSPEMHW